MERAAAHAYGVWMHVESRRSLVQQVTSQLILHFALPTAALCIHVTRLLEDCLLSMHHHCWLLLMLRMDPSLRRASTDFRLSTRIAMIAKARTAAGSLNLLRLLIHSVMVRSCSLQDPCNNLKQGFTYRSRENFPTCESSFEVSPNVVTQAARDNLLFRGPSWIELLSGIILDCVSLVTLRCHNCLMEAEVLAIEVMYEY
ncbi:hypothetical protein MPSEU_000770200 [Mayamaea pseudoterrestris]|nr:hypothetical protein MPSEU_000770200 [Mayamaea pseudoterrestris]